MKYSLIVLAALAGSYSFSNTSADLDSTSRTVSAPKETATQENWQLYSFSKDKSCQLAGDLGKGKSFDLPKQCLELIPGSTEKARLVARVEGYELVGTNNKTIAKFGTGEMPGFESYFPEHIHLVLEPVT